MTEPMTFDHAALHVDANKFDDFIKFYEEMLGWRVISYTETEDRRACYIASGSGASFEIRTTPNDLHFAFNVPYEDFDAHVERMCQAGVAFESFRGTTLRSAFFKDPMGNRLQLLGRSEPLGSDWEGSEGPAPVPYAAGSPTQGPR
jgi:predicted enzyme related to lactoylglutathione lyase